MATVLVVADDLIWADRLARIVEAVDATPVHARTAAEIDQELASADALVVDLTARAYEPIAAIELAARAGHRVLAVGQHDDVAVRKRALAAGAERVLAYRKLFEDGPSVLAAWLAGGKARAAP